MMEAVEFKFSDLFESSTVKKKNDYFKDTYDYDVIEILTRKQEIITRRQVDDFLEVFWDITVHEKDISIENKINKERENYLKTKVTNQLIETILEESFEFGIKSKSEILIEEHLRINELATRNWLNEIFIDYFDDEKILIGILRIIGRFDERLIFPQGQTMAVAALNHKNPEIKELGIRAFENWGSINSIKILENIDLPINWLCEYKNQVITDLKEELYVTNS